MRLERNVGQLTQDMTELKDLAVELVEENVALQVENDNLKRLMDKGEASSEHNDEKSHSKHIKTPSPSKDNLAMLYRKAFIYVKVNCSVNTVKAKIVSCV